MTIRAISVAKRIPNANETAIKRITGNRHHARVLVAACLGDCQVWGIGRKVRQRGALAYFFTPSCFLDAPKLVIRMSVTRSIEVIGDLDAMPPKNPHIVVVDDHRSIREPLARYLGENGFRVSMAANGAEMDTVVKAASIDLIVLDILMPGEGGLEICRRIRETRDIPVILLTSVADETSRIVGLEIGADDYLTKPFNPRELLARIKGVLRRVNSLPKQYSGIEAGQIGFGAWVLDVDRQALRKVSGDQETALSTVEFRLLMTFLSHPKMVLSRDQLLDMVSSRAANVFDRSIDNQVSRLRKKIEVDPRNPDIVKTVWGGGYMFTLDVARR